MTQIFFTSDTHFNHEVIIRYSQRPFADLSEMTEILVRNWNDRVGPGDIIYHLGDFAITFGPRRESKTVDDLLSRLNGNKFLILGNHDRKEVFQNRRWIKVVPYHEIKVDFEGTKRKIVLCHYPLRSWNRLQHGSWMLHGHCHGSLVDTGGGKIMDVGVDAHNFSPVGMKAICEFMANREIVSHDHHGRRSKSQPQSGDST